MSDVNSIMKESESGMKKALDHLKTELASLRAGKAAPTMLDSVHIDYYGSRTPLNQCANISTPDAKTLVIQPWDKSMIEAIEKGIMQANLGFNPQNDGHVVRINLPPLTEERRRDLVKFTKAEGENTKVSIRNIRKEANESLKKLLKDGHPEDEIKKAEDDVQQLTNKYIKEIDTLLEHKENEIMTV